MNGYNPVPWDAYPQLLNHYTTGVLDQMCRSGQCDVPTAQRIAADMNNWGHDFCGKLGNTSITEAQFCQYLSQYLTNLVGMVRPNAFTQPQYGQQPIGYQQPAYAMGGAYQQPATFRTNRFGNMGGMSQPQNMGIGITPVNPFTRGDKPIAENAPIQSLAPPPPIPVNTPVQGPVIPFTQPKMLEERSATFGTLEKVEFNKQAWTASGGKIKVDKIAANTFRSFVNIADAIDFVKKNVPTNCDNRIIQFGYREARGLPIKRQDFVACLESIREALDTLPRDKNNVLGIVEALNEALSAMTRRLANIVEGMVVERFNQYLQCKVLHHGAIINHGSIRIGCLQDLVDISQFGEQPVALKDYTANAAYEKSLLHYVAKATVEFFNNMEIAKEGDDPLHYVNALGNAVLSAELSAPTIRDMLEQPPVMADVIKKINETTTVILIPAVAFITDLPIGKNSKLSGLSGDKFVTLSNPSDDIDFLIKDMYTFTHPVDLVVHIDGNTHREFRLSRTTDSIMLISRA